jgi:hypothetical protein
LYQLRFSLRHRFFRCEPDMLIFHREIKLRLIQSRGLLCFAHWQSLTVPSRKDVLD